MTTNAMDTLLALKCRACGGEKQILCHAASDGDCNWDKCPQGWDINAHCRLDIQDDEEADIPPCPDCQHPITKQPTGLLIPGLVYPCAKTWNWGACTGAGQILTNEVKCPVCGDKPRTIFKNRKMPRHSGRLPDHTWDCNCQGTGLVPVSEYTALRVALEWLAETWCMNISCMDGTWFVILEVGDQCQVPTMGATPLEAIANAIKASVEVENHDN